MEIKCFEEHGRRIMVEFRCYRCNKAELRPLEECRDKECFRGLYDLIPPINWENGGFYYPLFCPDCKKAYKQFMSCEAVERCEYYAK